MLPQAMLPFPFSVMNSIGDGINRLGSLTPSLDVQKTQEKAMKQTGLQDLGDPHYAAGLEAYLEAAKYDGVNYFGKTLVGFTALEYAKTCLEWVEMQKRQPGAFATELLPPIIIIGLPRSGSTFLHRMLEADPQNQAIPNWRLLKPFPPLDGSKDNRHAAIRRSYKTIQKLRPDLTSKHEISADTPEECMVVQAISFNSFLLYASAPVYSYFDWYEKAERFTMYEEYASILRWYQAQDARRLVMKSPSHTPALRELLAAVPNVLLVQTHRDPVHVANSLNSLIHTLHTSLMKPYAPERMVKTNLRVLDMLSEASLTAYSETDLNICNVFYDDLIADPVGTVWKIYAHFELEWTEVYEQRLKLYVSDNPRGKHGAHRYSSANFGLTDAQIRERYFDYIKQYNL